MVKENYSILVAVTSSERFTYDGICSCIKNRCAFVERAESPIIVQVNLKSLYLSTKHIQLSPHNTMSYLQKLTMNSKMSHFGHNYKRDAVQICASQAQG